MKRKNKRIISVALTGLTLSIALIIGLRTSTNTAEAQATCPNQDNSRGVVTSTFNVGSSGSYNVWIRMGAQSASNDSFILEIDGTTCGIIMGDTDVPTSGWKWVNYRSGNTSNRFSVSLAAGQHNIKLIGREDGVRVDRILFVPSQSNCVPSNETRGDNCIITVDTEAPTTSITAPVAGRTIGGNFNLEATARDDIGVTRVEFYAGTTLLATDTTAPYSYNLNTNNGSFPNGSYDFTSVAFDAVGNQTRSASVRASIFNEPPDTTPPTVNITSPLANGTVSGTINITASASDASGIARVEFSIDNGSPVNTDTTSPYSFFYDTANLSRGNHTITARAFDNRGNQRTSTITVNVDNSVVPIACDFNNDRQVGLVDLSRLLTNYGRSVTPGTNGDCNGDGQVGLVDLSRLLAGYGR